MTGFNPQNPMIINEDLSVFIEPNNPLYLEARDQLARFAELVECPSDYMHRYMITPLGLWNAASSGMTADEICEALVKYAKYPIPETALIQVRKHADRYGALKLIKEDGQLFLVGNDKMTLTQIAKLKQVKSLLGRRLDETRYEVNEAKRGELKQALIKENYPVEDLAGYIDGGELDLELRDVMVSGKEFRLRRYQRDAAEIFHASGGARGGSGTFVLPCGAGKTVIGITSMSLVRQKTLILTTNITALRQWRDELLDKTSLTSDMIGEYSGEVKVIKPVTLTTYQLLTYRRSKSDEFVHMDLFNAENWGLIIYDEVHMLPAPIFRSVANIQARRRLGLTATLVREDGLEDDVFSLIGPKKFDMPWKDLEAQGWIAKATCIEIRVPLPRCMRQEFAAAEFRDQFRFASENPFKIDIIRDLVAQHSDDNILIIGQYIDQLEMISREFNAPIITGKTPNKERQEIYAAFKEKKYKVIIVSKVANFAIDLPDANVAIQVSGTFGSRQEEAQRLGRVLRSKGEGLENVAHFYSVTTKDTMERECAAARHRFLTAQGYSYKSQFAEFDDEAEKRAADVWSIISERREERNRQRDAAEAAAEAKEEEAALPTPPSN